MMTEKELICKIRKLRKIKPNRDWVVLTKKNILGEETIFSQWGLINLEGFRLKLIFASFSAVFVLIIGIFVLAQFSLPGQLLYPLKKITEKGQAVFVSEEEKPKYNLELVNKRLQELNQIAQSKEVKNIPPALKEVQKTKSMAKKAVAKTIKEKSKKSEKEAIKIAKDIAPKLNEINKKKEEVFAILNTQSPEEINQTAEKTILEILIKDAKNSTLTEEQKADLLKIEEYYKIGEYQKALELFLTSSLNPSY